MRTRFRIGPFTFGKSGTRLSPWKGGTGFSIPLFNRKSRSFGKVKLGMFSFYFGGKSKRSNKKKALTKHIEKTRLTYRKAYEPWTKKSDKELINISKQDKFFFRYKDVKEKKELERIILCDVQNQIYPKLLFFWVNV